MSGTPSGGDQSSVMGSSGGVPIVKTQALYKYEKFGCSQLFALELWRDEHQEKCGGLLESLEEDQVDTETEGEEVQGEKRPLSPSGAAAEEAKKARLIPPTAACCCSSNSHSPNSNQCEDSK